MLELVIDRETYTCEGGWNELSRSRMLKLLRMENTYHTEGKRLWARILFLLQPNKKQLRQLAALPPAVLHDIATKPECLGWVTQDDALLEEYTINGFWHHGIYYSGPPKRMLRIPAKELVMVHTYFSLYHRSQNPEHLQQLMALLYRPINPLWWLNMWSPEWTGDKRLALNDWTLQRRANRMAKVNPALTMAVVKQLSSALQLFEKRHKRIFAKGKKEGKDSAGGWVNLLFALSGGAFGNFKETENTDAALLFMKIEYDMEQHELQQKLLNDKKKK